jgi:predicted nucleic acid-binding protein
MLVVSNTSPVYNLACIERLILLHEQFDIVWIPAAVEDELRHVPDGTVLKIIEQAKQAGWLKTRPASNANLVSLLTVELHQGEAEAIALALEMKADRLLIDEKDGRALARQVGLRLTGVLGVLLRAKKTGRIKAIRPELEALRTTARFFVAPDLESTILAEAGE